ncbi:MAG: TonB-dependent receptor [Flammeovirgaceae bacterium]
MIKQLGLLLFFVLIYSMGYAQLITIKGKVKDGITGELLVGAHIIIKGTTQGATTNIDGEFTMRVNALPVTLQLTYVGYVSKEVEIQDASSLIQVTLNAQEDLDAVVIVGSRFNPRSVTTSPVPIDNVQVQDLIQTGQPTFDKMLTYIVPSFNSTQQTVSDATAHFDPADLRGLGPSRTLVLINGKRKNPSSLVYINDTPGKGEVGVDMKSIPIAAIKRVEVLRDGASAQYGSDAIAGVINVILKDNVDYTNLNITSGITTEGDGFNIGYNLNTGVRVGTRGFVNVSTSFTKQEETNRAGSPGEDLLIGADASNPWIQANPDLGMRIGLPQMTTTDIFFNAKALLDDNTELYGFGGLTYRRGTSYALYRAPYWVADTFNIMHAPGTEYQGFQPTFETEILDNTLALGLRGKKRDWNYDISLNFGGNSVDYTVGNTLNRSLGQESPTNFNAGGYEFSHIVTNLDLARSFGKANLSFGGEFRTENFISKPGEPASYEGLGAESFPGIQPENQVDVNRYNFGFYADLTVDVTDNFLIGGAARFEDYSDFGSNFTWKANARLKTADNKLVLRASASTGFRAPSLHQIYLGNIQTIVSGGTVSQQGTFNNQSPVIRALQVPELTYETSTNFTLGTALQATEHLSFTADFYAIQMMDRILFTSSIRSTDTTQLVTQVLQDYNITSIKFFTNAVNTNTRGVDIVASYEDIAIGDGKLNVTFSANLNETEIDGKIATPQPIADAGVDIFDRKEQSRITTSRPTSKMLLGLSYKLDKLTLILNNTRFGEVTWRHVDNGLNAVLGKTDEEFDQTFSAKIITDLYLTYAFTSQFQASIAVNNLLNVYPDRIDDGGDFITTLGGRFQYPWEVNQFGFNGTVLSGNIHIRF